MSQAVEQSRSRGRSIGSLVLFVLATLLLLPAVLGHWGDRTVVDTDRYVDTVAPLIEQPAVQEALSTAVTAQVVARVDTESQVESLLGNLLPDNSGITGLIAGPIASGINELIGNLVTKFVASDQFSTIWVDFNRVAHQSALAMLEGSDDGIVKLQGDDLVIDVSTALAAIQQHLVDNGVTIAANVPLPTTSRTIVLAHTPVLAQVRTTYQIAGPVLRWLPLLVVVLFALAIILARRHARTVVATGIVVVVAMLLVLFGINAGEAAVTAQLANTPWEGAVDAFWWTLLDFLTAGAQGLITLGVVLVVAGWFGGRTTSARWARGHLTRGLGDLSGRMLGGRRGLLPAGSLPYLRGAAYAVGLLLLLTANVFSVATVLWVGALTAGLLTVVQLLAGPAQAPAAPPTLAGPEAAALAG